VYRLLCRGSIEERMRQRALQKDKIHQMVIQQRYKETEEGEEDIDHTLIKDDGSNDFVNQEDLVQLLMEETC
jgi:SNF2 family DNA or RNA helicase